MLSSWLSKVGFAKFFLHMTQKLLHAFLLRSLCFLIEPTFTHQRHNFKTNCLASTGFQSIRLNFPILRYRGLLSFLFPHQYFFTKNVRPTVTYLLPQISFSTFTYSFSAAEETFAPFRVAFHAFLFLPWCYQELGLFSPAARSVNPSQDSKLCAFVCPCFNR